MERGWEWRGPHPTPITNDTKEFGWLVGWLRALDVTLATHSWCIHKVLQESFSIFDAKWEGYD